MGVSPVPSADKLFAGKSQAALPGGKTPGLGQMMGSLMGGGAPPMGAPAPVPPMGQPGMPPAMGGPAQPGSPLGMSPQDMDLMLAEIEKEMKKGIVGQSGQQDAVFTASEGLGRYRPFTATQNPSIPSPMGMPQDVQMPPGMSPQGLQNWRSTGNPNPGMGGPPMPPAPGQPGLGRQMLDIWDPRKQR